MFDSDWLSATSSGDAGGSGSPGPGMRGEPGPSSPTTPGAPCAPSSTGRWHAPIATTARRKLSSKSTTTYGLDLYRQKDAAVVCKRLGAWFRRGADRRKLRIYTQDLRWRTGIRANTPAETVTTGPSYATEDEAASSTLPFAPLGTFWTAMASEVTQPHPFGHFDDVPGPYFDVDAMHSALFMTHALEQSSLSD